jgi:DNA-binding NtrC family response regulator
VVVCGQFRANPGLARSELFGHAKGAFTGADSEREGILERVENDTLFLDEIADLDRGTQRLLIAAVEGRDFQRIGETRNRTAKFRLIAATNRPLLDLVASSSPEASGSNEHYGIDFDFFDRISTFILHIPPLRERREDLPRLWRSALARSCRRAGLEVATTAVLERDRGLLDVIAAHPLPGNLRDLQSAAWYGLASRAAGDGPAAAAQEAIAGLDHLAVPETSPSRPLELPVDLDLHLAAEERGILADALTRADGNKAQAAKLVKLARKTFEYRLNKHDIS